MQPIRTGISERVKAQYERFPYPDYGLFLPLRMQEAYASHSLFAARVLEQHGQTAAIRLMPSARVLLAGCGDVFPYMAAGWEPRRHHIEAVDLSGRSLRRARLRCLPCLRRMTWRMGNLEDPDFALPDAIAHIDCYGVLHHMADPAAALRRFGRCLPVGGTTRIMVYNSGARQWIRHLQRAFALLGLSAAGSEDPDRGKGILRLLAALSPALRERFAPMRGDAFANPARFVDTFLHAREARLDLGFWLRAIADGGLRVIGVFDRYAELDDLPNPLLEVPDLAAWQERVDDRRFENNFELYLAKPGGDGPTREGNGMALPRASRALLSARFLKSPAHAWFAYPETHGIPWILRRTLWSHFLRGLAGGNPRPADSWAGRLPPRALQRLGRIGVLFPDDFRSQELRDLIRKPLHDAMEPPDFSAPGPLSEDRGIRTEIARILREKNRPMKYLEAVMKRLDAAQRP